MIHIPLRSRLDRLDPGPPDLLGDYGCDGPAMVGLVCIPAGSTDHFWELHGGGDELLYLFEGRARFTACDPDGRRQEADVMGGDLLLLRAGEAHRARIEEDLRLLFITPRDGNLGWSEAVDVPPRH